MPSVLTAVGLAVCLAQAAPSPRNWSEVRSPEYGFRVEFPAAAAQSEPAPGRLKWSVELDNGFTAYLFETTAITTERLQTAGSGRVLDDSVAGGIAKVPGAAVLHRGPIEVGGNQGRELTMRAVHDGTALRLKCRVFLVGTRLYTLVAVSKDEGLDSPEADRFLTSFGLISR